MAKFMQDPSLLSAASKHETHYVSYLNVVAAVFD
jgi:hypothetical protein